MGGATAPVKTHPRACAAAAPSASHCSRMEKHAKVSLPVHKKPPRRGAAFWSTDFSLVDSCRKSCCVVRMSPVPPQILMSVSFTMVVANTSAGTPSAALSATAEKASSCWQMNVHVKVERAPELFYSHSGQSAKIETEFDLYEWDKRECHNTSRHLWCS